METSGIKGFHVRRQGRWWVIAPMYNLMPLHKLDAIEGKFANLYSFIDKRDMEAKLFELMEELDK